MKPHTTQRKRWCGLLLSLVTVFIGQFALADTEVGGNITEDTTWTEANSPYVATSDVQVWDDATLTIEPGVIVRVHPDIAIRVAGNIVAQGTESLPIIFTAFNPKGSWSGIELIDSADSVFEKCILARAIELINLKGTSTPVLRDNIIRDNLWAIGDWYGYQEMIVSYNDFINNDACFFGIRTLGNSVFEYNNFVDNESVFPHGYFFGTVEIRFNNFVRNNLVITAYEEGYGGSVVAPNNWWGTTDTLIIDNLIHDKHDDVSLQIIDYNPIEASEIENIGPSITCDITPNAHAGENQTVLEGEVVTLDGSDSTNADYIVSYSWKQAGGSTVTLSDSSAIQPTFSSPDVGPLGETLTFELTVINVIGQQDTDTVTIDVVWQNVPPTANAGPDQVVLDSNEVTLDGSGSYDPDPDGTIEYYEWLLLYRDREHPEYDRTAEGETPTISNLEPGFYDVTLTVTDDDKLTDTDTMLLAVARPCLEWPQPNAGLITKKLEIKEGKNDAKLKVDGTINLPELDVSDVDIIESRTTIEIFGVLPDGGDLVISSEDTLEVKYKKYLEIKK